MIGTLSSVKSTTPSYTSKNLVSGGVQPSIDVLERHYQKHYPQITLGNVNLTTSFVTTDVEALSFQQGKKVSSVEFEFKGVATDWSTSTLALTKSSDTVKYTISDMYVQDVVAIESDNEGKSETEYTVTLKACVTAAGAEPTIARTITPSGSEE